MTFFDGGPTELEWCDSIYGGPRHPAAVVRQLLKHMGMELPCRVVAVRHGETPPPFLNAGSSKVLPGTFPFRIHPGITWVFFQDPFEPLKAEIGSKRLLYGDVWTATTPESWFPACQNSVVSLRRVEMAEPRRIKGLTITSALEDQTRATAIQQLKNNDAAGWESLSLWTEIVLKRHDRSLNSARRRLAEFLAQLTRDAGERKDLGYPFRAAIRRIYETWPLTDLQPVFEETVRGLMPQILLSYGDPLDGKRPRSEALARALDFMRDHFHEPIGLAEVAAAAHISAAHLSRLFRKEAGRTLTDHLQAVRIRRAKERLTESEDNLRSIARATGFATLEHFFRTFRKRVGMTPQEYRAAHRA